MAFYFMQTLPTASIRTSHASLLQWQTLSSYQESSHWLCLVVLSLSGIGKAKVKPALIKGSVPCGYVYGFVICIIKLAPRRTQDALRNLEQLLEKWKQNHIKIQSLSGLMYIVKKKKKKI